jgi:hypothetical protein
MRISRTNTNAILLWVVMAMAMAMTTTMLSTNALTKTSAASDGAAVGSDSAESPVCEESPLRDPPKILANGSFQNLEDLSSFQDVTTLSFDTLLDGTHRGMSSKTTDDDAKNDANNTNNPTKIAAIPGGEPIDLRYVKDLVSPETAAALIGACDKRSGWTTSPQSMAGTATVTATRTSRSCPLIWPQMYLPLLNDPAYKSRIEASGLTEEIDLTWRLTQRVSQLLNVGEEFVEPFQLVRYQPGEFYKEHHDHGSYYGVNTEQRPLTLLVFLSDLPSNNNQNQANSGGYTKFRALGNKYDKDGVSVVPRMGDGVLWKNEDEDGNLLMDAIHEAVPPEDQEGIIKYAMNVWIAKKPIRDNLDVSAYRTR